MMDNRRAFFGKVFSLTAAAAVAAKAADDEALIIVPQPAPVELYARLPKSLEYVHDGQVMTAAKMNELVNSINVLNLAVFGPKQ